MRPDQIALHSATTRHENLEQALDAYADAGFKAVEFDLGEVVEPGADAIAALLNDRGLRCAGGYAPPDGELACFAGQERLTETIAEVTAGARMLDTLGGGVLVFYVDAPEEPKLGDLDAIVSACSQTVEATDGLDVTLAIEFNAISAVRSLQSALRVSEAVDHDRFGVIFDTAHYYSSPTKLDHLTPEAVASIVHVHLADLPDVPGDFVHAGFDRVLPGEGILPLNELIEALERGGYEGEFSFEMFSEEIWSLPVGEAARRCHDALMPLCA